MLVAISFTACSSDITEDDNNGTVVRPTAQTVFSSADDDGTRTSIDKKANFYWEKGDKIWIDGGTGFEPSSQSNITTTKQAKAKFVVDGTYTENEYKVLYTGYANGDTTQTFYNKVTIAHQQTQKAWNDGSHLGTSGDCGTSIAYKQTGAPGYKFTIDHKASYLLLYPYLHTDMSGYTLEKVEIYSDVSASNIAGTFTFDFNNGLLNADGTPKTPQDGTAKQEITLNCDGGFQLSQDVPNVTSTTTYRHLFVVIAPGTHQLTIKYFAKNASNQSVEFVKDLALTKYEPNGVYPYIHKLSQDNVLMVSGFEFIERDMIRQWSGTNYGTPTDWTYWYSTTEITHEFWALAPRAKDIQTYMGNGIFYDNSIIWTYNRVSGTTEERRGGWWLKKMAFCNLPGRNGTECTMGRPDAATRGQYFFLPHYKLNDTSFSFFWTRTPSNSSPSATTSELAMALVLSPTIANEGIYRKSNGFVAGRRPDGTPWFQ